MLKMLWGVRLIWYDMDDNNNDAELTDNPDRLLNWPIRAGISSTGRTDPRATTLLYINNRPTELSESVCDSFESVSQQPKMWAPQRNFISVKKGMNVPASGTTHYLYLCPWRACFSPFLGAFQIDKCYRDKPRHVHRIVYRAVGKTEMKPECASGNTFSKPELRPFMKMALE